MVSIKSIRKLSIVLICIAVSAVLLAVILSLLFKNIQRNLDDLSVSVIDDIDISKIADGTYEGSYKVFPVSVDLEVTVENGRITAVEINRHINGKGEEAESITDEVIRRQSLDVDAVSGATYSSRVILRAIEDALKDH